MTFYIKKDQRFLLSFIFPDHLTDNNQAVPDFSSRGQLFPVLLSTTIHKTVDFVSVIRDVHSTYLTYDLSLR